MGSVRASGARSKAASAGDVRHSARSLADADCSAPCDPKMKAASLRAMGRSKLSETNTIFPCRVMTSGPSSELYTC